LVLTGLSIATWVKAQPAQQTTTQGIYTCVDARGRKLTSDRPIAECTDREQKVLNPSGTLKAKVGPTLTAQERAQLEAREKAELEEQARLNEEKRRDRALLTRYPSKAVHDNERAQALAQIGVVRQASVNRVEELQRQRKILADEMEFYKKDPNKAPPSLRRQVDEVAHSLSVQARFIADQDAELQRVNTRFDEELARLNQLWAMQSPLPGASSKKH
jgi:type I site-specific restriction endonuclease